ncbi:MAG: hypothetical protein QX196_02135, partial [Methylococcaceae bacterium]
SCVGRNKAFRAQARISVSGIRYECAGNATTRYAPRQAQDRLGLSYSGLRLFIQAIAEAIALQFFKQITLNITELPLTLLLQRGET